MKRTLLPVLFLLASSSLFAQSPPSHRWDYSDAQITQGAVTHFERQINGGTWMNVGLTIAADQSGAQTGYVSYYAALPALPEGDNTIVVRACNTSKCSDLNSLVVTVLPPPPPPAPKPAAVTNHRIDAAPEPPPPTEVCGNGVDDDGDGLVDEDCAPPPPPPAEVCGNGIDDDGDGSIDEDCAPPPPPPSGSAHDYFNARIASSECFRAFSLRPEATQTTTITTCEQSRFKDQLLGTFYGGFSETRSRPYTITYCPTGAEPNCTSADTDQQKQDAARLALPMWISYEGVTLAANVDSATTNIPLSATFTVVANGGIKIDNEIMRALAPPSGGVLTVERGAFGTIAAAHSVGTPVARNNNINYNQLFLPINSNGAEDATYFFTWDTYYTDSFIANRHGLQVHKTFHFNSWAGDDNWFRADAGYIPYPDDNVAGLFDPSVDVGVVRGRRLFNPLIPPSPPADMHEPMLPWGDNGRAAIIKPNTWGRWFVQIDTRAEGVAANFTPVTTLSASVTSVSATTLTITCPAALFGENCPAFTSSQAVGGASWPGRSLKINDEMMTITSGVSSGDTTTLTVVRGAYGTTAATHSSGASVGLVHDYITLWYADENNDAVELLKRYPAHLDENHATVNIRGALMRLRIEVSTSTDTIKAERVAAGQRDLVMYLRNVVFLKNPSNIPSLLIRPLR